MTDLNSIHMEKMLQPFGPKSNIEEIVREVNRLYHEAEATRYDRRHPEIYDQLPGIWAEMLQLYLDSLGAYPSIRVLDFGCGTGFEVKQLLASLPEEAIGEIICYDPSEAMIEQCKANLANSRANVVFTSRYDDAIQGDYDLIITNSLLHHLPDYLGTIKDLGDVTKPEGYWIAGHEPSRRFYLNSECTSLLEAYETERRWRRYLSPRNYWSAARRKLGLEVDPAEHAAIRSVEEGYFTLKPDAHIVGYLVDFSVAHSSAEAEEGRGIDFAELQSHLNMTWQLKWVRSYSFMGPYYENQLPRKWASEAAGLSEKFPLDGANFSTVWKKLS